MTGAKVAYAHFALACGISWTIWLGAVIFFHADASSLARFWPYLAAGSFGPTIAAAVLIALQSGRKAAYGRWLKSMIKVKNPWWVYAVALLALPLICCGLTLAFGITAKASAHFNPLMVWATLFPASLLNGIAQMVIGAGPLGEEPGWRGFALPNLLTKFNDLGASVIIGIVWSLWHLPMMWLCPEWREYIPFAQYLPVFTVDLMLMAYCATKIWRWSNGSTFLLIWLHGLSNVVWGFAFTPPLWNVRGASQLTQELMFTLSLALFVCVIWAVGRSRPARARAAAGLIFSPQDRCPIQA